MKGKLSISTKIAALPDAEQKAWIAGRKKGKNPKADWDGGLVVAKANLKVEIAKNKKDGSAESSTTSSKD